MISVIIPTLDAEGSLTRTLAALVPAAVDGILREVIVVDGGSTDGTAKIADEAGTEFFSERGGRGSQLAAAARRAKSPWLLFLHADTVLEPGWESEASTFIYEVDTGKRQPSAGAFRFALDDRGMGPRLLERCVALRCSVFRLPYGDQGLLIPRSLYEEAGGFRPHPVMEDVDLIRRLKRRRVAMLQSRAVTDARRFRESGYVWRSARNLSCLALYFFGMSTARIARVYR
jgi:rSAM/selenodomain-associated transferase 2